MSREDAERLAQDPANHPVYENDLAHECVKCGRWHLSKIEWLVNQPMPQAVN
jgi:hypothetical protein